MKTAAVALAFVWLIGVGAFAGGVRPVVVEVYTSQGCNSCLPANMMAGKLAERPGLLVLSFPVTYWDMFGWKDTLASDDNTRRQKSYAASLRHGGIYTPQMIIDGVKDVPASREDAVSFALAMATMARDDGMTPDEPTPAVTRRVGVPIAFVAGARVKTLARTAWSVPVWLKKQADMWRIGIDRAPEVARHSNVDATVWLFRLRSNATVKIGGGENAGTTVNYRNVVTGTQNLGHWNGEPRVLEVPRPQGRVAPYDSIAVVVQQGGYGRVIGAAQLTNAAY